MKVEIHKALERYVRYRIPTGSFLRAVLENSLSESVALADEENERDLHEICRYIYDYLPVESHGSPEIVKEWLQGRHKV